MFKNVEIAASLIGIARVIDHLRSLHKFVLKYNIVLYSIIFNIYFYKAGNLFSQCGKTDQRWLSTAQWQNYGLDDQL